MAGSSVEGTSGLANPVLLRGRAGEAALSPGSVRVSGTGGARLLPFRAWVGAVGSRWCWSLRPARWRSRDERCPSGAGWVIRSPAPLRACGSPRTWLRPRPDLARETSAGVVDAVERSLGLVPRARRRYPCSLQGDQAVSGRARGSIWLQKSTSGARSKPKGYGSSSLAPRVRGRAPRAKARRKPGRGGESRQHA